MEERQELATYMPPVQTPYGQYMPPAGMQPYIPAQSYLPKTMPLIPTVAPANPATQPLNENSVIIAPKKPTMRLVNFKMLFTGIILLAVFAFFAFMISAYFVVDNYRPFDIIGDFFGHFNFGEFFTKFFTGTLWE